jgi:hypothetical protein
MLPASVRHIVGTVKGDILSGGKPHPQSYGADLPMWHVPQIRVEGETVRPTASLAAWAKRCDKQADAPPAAPTLVSARKPHPNSYRPDLPTLGFPDGQLTRITAEDRKAYAARPLTLLPAKPESAYNNPKALRMSEKGLEKARSLFTALNIVGAR